jgi:hypothetical protein
MSNTVNTNIPKLLEKANAYLKDPDTIIDPYDMTYVWVSEMAKFVLGDDCVGKPVVRDSPSSDGTDDHGRLDMAVSLDNHKVSRRSINLKLKSGESKEMQLDYVFIEFDNQPYLVTKSVR